MLMAEFLTAVRHQLPVKVVINNNNALGQILWEQMVLGYPEYGVRIRDPFSRTTPACATANGALGAQGDQGRATSGRDQPGAQPRRARRWST